jgi:hypothetical protein
MVKSLTDIDIYRDANDFVNVLATPYNYEDDEHYLRSYYIGATNTLLSGVHLGNMSDIYIEDKTRIAATTQSVVMTSQELVLKTSGLFNLPIVDIIGISRTLTGAAYVENIDYSVERPTEGTAFSTRDDIKIVFSDPGIIGISVDIQYRYYQDGQSVQDLLESDQYRYLGTDNLAKIKPLSIVSISNMDYKGPVAPEVVRGALITHINNISDGSLELSDLISAAYNAGATFVDLTTFTASVKDQTYLGTYSTTSLSATNDTYILTGNLKTFFADSVSIFGLNKLD